MIKSLKVENLKSLKKIKLSEMKMVTIIGGKNGSGKTTILEAIFIVLARTNPDTFMRLLSWRGEQNVKVDIQNVIEPLFHNYDKNSVINIEIGETIKSRNLKMTYNPNGTAPEIPQNIQFKSNYITTSSVDSQIRGEMLEIQYEETGGKVHNHKLLLGNDNAIFNNGHNDFEKVIAGFISTQLRPINDETAIFYDNAKLMKNEQDILEAIQIMEPSVRDIYTSGNRVFFDIGLEQYKPITFFGDGVARLMYLLVSIVERKNGILLIDEIERGFHYSIHDKVWESIIKLASKSNCQIIATTHSYEMIQSIVESIQIVDTPEIAYFRIEKGEKAERYSYNELSKSLEKFWEVR